MINVISDSMVNESTALPDNFCIIESRDTVQDYAQLQLEEINDNIQARRNKIFLLMEEVRRLRVQKRAKSALYAPDDNENEPPALSEYPSALPLLPSLKDETISQYYIAYGIGVTLLIAFGGILAPSLEVRLGLGGTSYAEFINMMNLPVQLSQVDPIVASFTGGAVGVLTSLLLVEVNNVKSQAKSRCWYCQGNGYLACAACAATGASISCHEGPNKISAPVQLDVKGNPTISNKCIPCSGTGKVMCTSCLCTGMALASEHDPRIDPFD